MYQWHTVYTSTNRSGREQLCPAASSLCVALEALPGTLAIVFCASRLPSSRSFKRYRWPRCLTAVCMSQVKEFLSTIMLPTVSREVTQQSQSTQAPVATSETCSASCQKVVLFAHHKTVMNLLQIMLEDHFQVCKDDSPGTHPPALFVHNTILL